MDVLLQYIFFNYISASQEPGDVSVVVKDADRTLGITFFSYFDRRSESFAPFLRGLEFLKNNSNVAKESQGNMKKISFARVVSALIPYSILIYVFKY